MRHLDIQITNSILKKGGALGIPMLILLSNIWLVSSRSFMLSVILWIMFALINSIIVFDLTKNWGRFAGGATIINWPKPSYAQLLLLFINPFIIAILFLVGSAYIAVFLRYAGITNFSNWIIGVAVTFLWAYLFSLMEVMTTRYAIRDEEIYIQQGIQYLHIPYIDIAHMDIHKNLLSLPWIEILQSGHWYLYGVRWCSFVSIKRIKWNICPRIYLTPSNPSGFIDIINTKILSQRAWASLRKEP